MAPKPRDRYTTLHEMRFIEKLGTHSDKFRGQKIFLLKQYLKTPRSNWGSINQNKILNYVRDELYKLIGWAGLKR